MSVRQSLIASAQLFRTLLTNPGAAWPDSRSSVSADGVATLAVKVVIDGAASQAVRSAMTHLTALELGSGVLLSPTADPDLVRAFDAVIAARMNANLVRTSIIVRQVRRDLLKEFGLTTSASYPVVGTFAESPKLMQLYGGSLADNNEATASRMLMTLIRETAGDVLADRIQSSLRSHGDQLRPIARRLLLAIVP
ncbi:MAG: hypothetical protein U0638_12580 [Phycisphaerales bacterium]